MTFLYQYLGLQRLKTKKVKKGIDQTVRCKNYFKFNSVCYLSLLCNYLLNLLAICWCKVFQSKSVLSEKNRPKFI